MVAINKEKEALITQELLKKKLHYDKDTGIFTWTDSKLNSTKTRGKQAGNANKPNGYRRIAIKLDGKNRFFTEHRLAWLYVYGKFPELSLDHINHDKLDNRISNLREVTHRENSRNKSINKNNTSGYSGVSFNKKAGKYEARVQANGRLMFLGYFEKAEDAFRAVKEAREHYGFHVNHGQTND